MQLYDYRLDTIPSNGREIWVRAENEIKAKETAKRDQLLPRYTELHTINAAPANTKPFLYVFKTLAYPEQEHVFRAVNYHDAWLRVLDTGTDMGLYLHHIERQDEEKNQNPSPNLSEDEEIDETLRETVRDYTLNISVDTRSDTKLIDILDVLSDIEGLLSMLGTVSIGINEYDTE